MGHAQKHNKHFVHIIVFLASYGLFSHFYRSFSVLLVYFIRCFSGLKTYILGRKKDEIHDGHFLQFYRLFNNFSMVYFRFFVIFFQVLQ